MLVWRLCPEKCMKNDKIQLIFNPNWKCNSQSEKSWQPMREQKQKKKKKKYSWIDAIFVAIIYERTLAFF